MSYRHMSGLGVLTHSEQVSLELGATRVHAVLDEISQRVRIAATQGVDVGSSSQDAYDEIRSGLDRLVERVPALDTPVSVAEWQAELSRLAAGADQLNRDVQAAVSGETSAGKARIGLWTGAAVLGAIGFVLGVRWYAKRRQR